MSKQSRDREIKPSSNYNDHTNDCWSRMDPGNPNLIAQPQLILQSLHIRYTEILDLKTKVICNHSKSKICNDLHENYWLGDCFEGTGSIPGYSCKIKSIKSSASGLNRKNQRPIQCWWCGGWGHTVKECPSSLNCQKGGSQGSSSHGQQANQDWGPNQTQPKQPIPPE